MICKICIFWDCGGVSNGKPYSWGYCCLKAPAIIPKTKDISKGYDEYSTVVSDGHYTAWPKTNSTDLCGEFKPRGKTG